MIPKELLGIADNLILLGYRGSVAHNMYIPNSDPNSIDDIDLMGVFVAPAEHYIGLDKHKETIEKIIEVDGVMWDCVFHELHKFVKLLLKGNPNVLSLLWIKPDHYIHMTDDGKRLVDNRDIFTCKQAFHSFAGYAYGQFKRMEHFNKKGYMGEKRKRLVDKYGFDPKNAAHLIRLLVMCIEFISTGKLEVYREEDRKVLLDIKTGKWSLEDVKYVANELFKSARMAYCNSKLIDKPNSKKAEKIVMNILLKYILEADYNASINTERSKQN